MTENFIDLTDGTRLEVKVNFGTLYFLQKCKGFYRKMKKVDAGRKLSESESFDTAADIVYSVLRSNGKAVTREEAVCLVPAGLEGLESVLNAFQAEYAKYNKKKVARTSVMPARSK